MGKPNRTRTPVFKAQVALAALKGDRTISRVAARYETLQTRKGTGSDTAGRRK